MIVYDCMDELSAFRGAPPQLTLREAELLGRAHVGFTGGQQAASRPSAAAIPTFMPSPAAWTSTTSSGRARWIVNRRTRRGYRVRKLGFYGVLDERFDTDLVAPAAAARP